MLVGRQIWLNTAGSGDMGDLLIDCRVLRFMRFLPAGPVASGEPKSAFGVRVKDLLKLYTDPGGMRVVAVDEILLKKPRG
jgi:hypothetical protein